jgi:hypothetical protein
MQTSPIMQRESSLERADLARATALARRLRLRHVCASAAVTVTGLTTTIATSTTASTTATVTEPSTVTTTAAAATTDDVSLPPPFSVSLDRMTRSSDTCGQNDRRCYLIVDVANISKAPATFDVTTPYVYDDTGTQYGSRGGCARGESRTLNPGMYVTMCLEFDDARDAKLRSS